jgi:hypothetical protein
MDVDPALPKRRGRPPIGEVAMTDAERQERRRERLLAERDKGLRGQVARLRHENRELRGEVAKLKAKLQAEGKHFDLLLDPPRDIAFAIKRITGSDKARLIAGLLLRTLGYDEVTAEAARRRERQGDADL